jgi:hypothetical protein
MAIADGSTIITGANSEVIIAVNNGTITFKSLTTAKLRGVSLTGTSSTADVALKNGTVVSDVKQIKGLKTSFTITTPVGTSSVRGTTHTVSFSAERGMEVAVAKGIVAIASNRGAARPVAAGLSYVQSNGAEPPQVSSQAAQEAVVPDLSSAYELPEESAVASGSGGASDLSNLIGLIASGPTTGTAHVIIVFP